MVREYEMTGAMPIIVSGHGRVEPGSGRFRCEMDPAQEEWFVKIGSVAVVGDGGEASPAPSADLEGGVIEFEGKTMKAWPTSWPRRPEEG